MARMSGADDLHAYYEHGEEVDRLGWSSRTWVGVEGRSFAVADLGERLADPVDREVVLEAARVVQRVPELLVLSPHLPAVARVP
jgi:hypothetical protein